MLCMPVVVSVLSQLKSDFLSINLLDSNTKRLFGQILVMIEMTSCE